MGTFLFFPRFADRKNRNVPIVSSLRLKNRNVHFFSRTARRSQASLEMTLAIIGLLLLLFGSFKLLLWMSERMIRRQQDYDTSRAAAANGANPTYEPTQRLDFFR